MANAGNDQKLYEKWARGIDKREGVERPSGYQYKIPSHMKETVHISTHNRPGFGKSMDFEAIAKKLGNTPKFRSASDKELFSVEPQSPYKCRTCRTKVESGPVAPRGAGQCRDCYHKDMFSKADNTVQYKRHIAEHPWKTDKVARTADDLKIVPKDNVARTADDLKIVVNKAAPWHEHNEVHHINPPYKRDHVIPDVDDEARTEIKRHLDRNNRGPMDHELVFKPGTLKKAVAFVTKE